MSDSGAGKIQKREYVRGRSPEESAARRRARSQIYYQKNRDRIIARVLVRYHKSQNKPKDRAREAEYRRIRRETDLSFRIRTNLSTRISMAVARGSKKAASSASLLGCTINFLRQWLEARFAPGMSWGNYGQWHIDHIIPCAEFDLRKKSQQLRCFHYSNLQPLWRRENISKNAKVMKQSVMALA